VPLAPQQGWELNSGQKLLDDYHGDSVPRQPDAKIQSRAEVFQSNRFGLSIDRFFNASATNPRGAVSATV